MDLSLGTCFESGTDIPLSIADTSEYADRVIFGCDVEVIRDDEIIHIYTLDEQTPLGWFFDDRAQDEHWLKSWPLPFRPVILVMGPHAGKRMITLDKVLVHGHPRSMPCGGGHG